ncbi:methyltransferase [Geminocystis sp. GBBB08]|uniref:methyltransferase n=1 Tax=Geminocystis sp. GBBB08 TaxID=2604140 RepID=UPI0027E2CD46|nr:methyltransferase [Geminocystis sp. GBBB08]MBL1210750.1 methyltransferase [Geminocystis sp. GBBB08]
MPIILSCNELVQMAMGHWYAQIIYVTARLQIVEIIAQGKTSLEEIALATKTDKKALYRLFRVLVNLGLLNELENAHFQLNSIADYLKKDHPQSIWATVMMMGNPERYQAWGELLYSIQTGNSAFEHCFEENMFDYLAHNPESAYFYQQTMKRFSGIEAKAITKAYDFSSFDLFVDIGGGYGELLTQLLSLTKHQRGILFDKSYVIEKAKNLYEQSQFKDRLQYIEGSFFEAIPSHGDAYFLKNILHDWNDNKALEILQNCYNGMPNHASLFILEDVIDSGLNDISTTLLDLNMLIIYQGGKERSQQEFEELLAKANFNLDQIITTEDNICILKCYKN